MVFYGGFGVSRPLTSTTYSSLAGNLNWAFVYKLLYLKEFGQSHFCPIFDFQSHETGLRPGPLARPGLAKGFRQAGHIHIVMLDRGPPAFEQ